MPNRFIALIGEDDICMAVLEKLVVQFNPELCVKYRDITKGFGKIKASIPKYSQASNHIPHIILTDLDRHTCPQQLMRDWGVYTNINLVFRIAVREVETWLIADRNGFATFLGVNLQLLPPYPEELLDPKQWIFNNVGRSRISGLAKDLLPAKNSLASIGPLYNERLTDFVSNYWNPVAASDNSPSLAKAILRVKELPA